jgi:hypothetical protein
MGDTVDLFHALIKNQQPDDVIVLYLHIYILIDYIIFDKGGAIIILY